MSKVLCNSVCRLICQTIIIVTFLFIATNSSGITLRVPSEYPTFQSGIDNAHEDDTVLIAPGSYSGTGNHSLDFGTKNVVLRSEDGRQSTLVDLAYSHRFLTISGGQSSATVVQGFTIVNGRQPFGGAIYCNNSSMRIRTCNFIGNAAVTFEPNGFGGAIFAVGSSSVKVEFCEFISNGAGVGGAILADQGSSVAVFNSRFEGNTCVIGYGGAVAVYGANVLLDHCLMIANTASQPGGSIYASNGNIELFAITIARSNGIVLEDDSFLDMSQVTLTYCLGTPSAASAIQLNGYNRILLANSIVAYGVGASPVQFSGGGQLLGVSCCDFFGNDGGDWVGPLAGLGTTSNNFNGDPQFCDSELNDFALKATSPCTPTLSPCQSLVGSVDKSCGVLCCQGIAGDINSDFEYEANIADLTYLVNMIWRSGPPARCFTEADVFPDYNLDISDLTYLVGFMFKNGPELPYCPDL